LKGNWKTIKEALKVGGPMILGMTFFQNNPALIATVTGFGKLALDALEFYLTEVEL
jgi:hypothetical protein